MTRQTALLSILAVALTCGAAYANWSYFSSVEAKEVPLVPVVMAAAPISVSRLVTVEQLKIEGWPAEHVPPGSFRELSAVVARIPRRPFLAGELVLESGLLPEGAQGGLSPLIEPGKRAMSVKVDEVIAIAGFVKPGASVDVVAASRKFSKVIIEDVQVLTVDQKLDDTDPSGTKNLSVVTLEVTPEQVERLAMAMRIGGIFLVLRNPLDGASVATSSVEESDLRRTGASRGNGVSRTVEVVKGPTVTSQSFGPAGASH